MSQAAVFGGTRGIGREVVKRLAGDGLAVTAVGRRAPTVEDAALPGVRHLQADLVADDLSALAASIRAGGPISAAVFCQRFKGPGDAWAGELAATLSATRALLEALAGDFDPAGGAVVLVGSVVGHLVSPEQEVGYHVAKAGLAQLARFYAVRLGPRGVRVNCVSPSLYVKDESRAYYAEHPELVSLFSGITPLGRMGTAGEIADVIRFLCSPAAAFVTGQELVVDGGLSLQNPPALARQLAGPR